jgi:hypothetical protein
MYTALLSPRFTVTISFHCTSDSTSQTGKLCFSALNKIFCTHGTDYEMYISYYCHLFLLCAGQNGKYWHVDGESVTADTDVPEGFFLELRDPTRICIKSVSGEYLVASKNGAFRLGDPDFENATKWEY